MEGELCEHVIDERDQELLGDGLNRADELPLGDIPPHLAGLLHRANTGFKSSGSPSK